MFHHIPKNESFFKKWNTEMNKISNLETLVPRIWLFEKISLDLWDFFFKLSSNNIYDNSRWYNQRKDVDRWPRGKWEIIIKIIYREVEQR